LGEARLAGVGVEEGSERRIEALLPRVVLGGDGGELGEVVAEQRPTRPYKCPGKVRLPI
jgi:hypothetical protein